jgi:hypothetical protein
MKQTNPGTFRNVVKSINETYGFMLARGYEVISVDDYDLGWQAVLRKQDLFAQIIRSRGEEEIFFRPGTLPPDEFIDIGSVIYAATGDQIPRWESSNPKVIERYLDKIETYFSGEYVRNQNGLRAAQKAISEASWKAYYETVGKADDEAFSQAGVVPPEPKGKPILYYPLMIIIILLILGALVTLCMVLLDRLFSLF